MKQFSTIVVAAATGAIVAFLLSGLLGYRRGSVPAARIEAREFVLLDENNQRAAVLESIGGRSALRFYAGNSAPALELGVEKSRTVRFLRFIGKDHRVLAALNSLPPNGETTLYLGDERWGARFILGALETDIPATTGVNDWGLVFRRLGSTESLFNVHVQYDDDPRLRSKAAISLLRRDGTLWGVY
jgi:hypothetical protein